MSRALTLVVGLLILVSGPARAQDEGFYFALRGGPNFLPELEDGIGVAGPVTLELEYNPGFSVSGALGYQFRRMTLGRFRLEAELDYQQNNLDDARLEGAEIPGIISAQITKTDGSASFVSLMANGYFDFDFGWPVFPFVGGGVGVSWISLNEIGGTVEVDLPIIGPVEASGNISDDTEAVAAAQAMVGLTWPFAEHWAASFSYRGFLTEEADFNVNIPLIGRTDLFETMTATHGARLELRYRF